MMAQLSLCACAHSVRDQFEIWGYRYPYYVERTLGIPSELGLDGRCARADGERAFIESAVAAIADGEVERLARNVCPRAEAAVLRFPFVQLHGNGPHAQDAPGKYLAMEMECFGKDRINDLVTFEEARGGLGTGVFRQFSIEEAVGSWPVDFLGDWGWHMWNVALFRVADGHVTFERFVYEYNYELLLGEISIGELIRSPAPVCGSRSNAESIL